MPNSIPDEILARKSTWHAAALYWKWAGIVITLVGTLAGLSVTALSQNMGPLQIKGAAFLAAAATAILAFLKPLREGSRYREAWRILDSACLEYSLSPAPDHAVLIQAVRNGENTIGHIEASSLPASPAGKKKK
jgi:hypothetical protein